MSKRTVRIDADAASAADHILARTGGSVEIVYDKPCEAQCFGGVLICSVDDIQGAQRSVVMKCDSCELYQSDDDATVALINFLKASKAAGLIRTRLGVSHD